MALRDVRLERSRHRRRACAVRWHCDCDASRRTPYTIPSESDCRACHEGAPVPVLGFSALQLSSDRDPLAPHAEPANGLDLRALVARGWLRNLPPEMLEQPPRIAAASPTERAVLGYLHGNCGHCHSRPDEAGASVPVSVVLAQSTVEPNSAAAVVRSLDRRIEPLPAGGHEADDATRRAGRGARERAHAAHALTRSACPDAAARHRSTRFRSPGAHRALDRHQSATKGDQP